MSDAKWPASLLTMSDRLYRAGRAGNRVIHGPDRPDALPLAACLAEAVDLAGGAGNNRTRTPAQPRAELALAAGVLRTIARSPERVRKPDRRRSD